MKELLNIEQIQNQIYGKTLGVVIRHFLQFFTGVLTTVGVKDVMQGQLFDALVPTISALIFSGFAFIWAYLQKRHDLNAKAEALEAKPGTSVEVIEKLASKSTPGPNFVGTY